MNGHFMSRSESFPPILFCFPQLDRLLKTFSWLNQLVYAHCCTMKTVMVDLLEGLGVEYCPTAVHLQVSTTENINIMNDKIRCLCVHVCVCVCICVCISLPVVHVPEELQVELVDGVVDLLSVALH